MPIRDGLLAIHHLIGQGMVEISVKELRVLLNGPAVSRRRFGKPVPIEELVALLVARFSRFPVRRRRGTANSKADRTRIMERMAITSTCQVR